MHVLPPLEQTKRFRHFSCPQCQSSLEQVRERSTGTVNYVCRIGHRYSPAELLIGKELAVEQLLWTSVAAMDELIAVIDELCELEEMKPTVHDCLHRAENAAALRDALEQILSRNEPTRLDCGVSVEVEPGSPIRGNEG